MDYSNCLLKSDDFAIWLIKTNIFRERRFPSEFNWHGIGTIIGQVAKDLLWLKLHISPKFQYPPTKMHCITYSNSAIHSATFVKTPSLTTFISIFSVHISMKFENFGAIQVIVVYISKINLTL